jgi:hypothetical protein
MEPDLAFSFFFTTGRTKTPVNTDRSATCNAGPALFFHPDKCTDALVFNRFKIFDHTHAILVPIPVIQLMESPARVDPASKAESAFQVCTGTNYAVFMAFSVG